MEHLINEFHVGVKVIYGIGALGTLAETLKDMGSQKVFIVTDAGLLMAGIVDRVLSILKSTVDYEVFDQVEPNPRDTTVMKGVDLVEKTGADLVIGLGGGSSMDCAKVIRVLSEVGGHVKDYEGFNNFNCLPERKLVLIPTTAGTGSEMGRWAIISDTNDNYKMAYGDLSLIANTSIVDPELCLSLPPHITAQTAMDAFSHALEPFVANENRENPIIKALSLQAMKLIFENVETAFTNGKDIQARSNLSVGSMMAGITEDNGTCGGIHAVAEAVGGEYDLSHGLCISSFMPSMIKYNADVVPSQLTEAKAFLELNKDLWEELADLNKKLNLPRPSELGIRNVDIERIAEVAENNASTQGNPKEMKKGDYQDFLEQCLSNNLW